MGDQPLRKNVVEALGSLMIYVEEPEGLLLVDCKSKDKEYTSFSDKAQALSAQMFRALV